MRVSTFIVFERISRSIQDNLRKIFEANEQISSGKRINRPSDDPVAMSRIMDYRLGISSNRRYLNNIDDAASYLEFADGIMDSTAGSLMRVKELALTALGGAVSAAELDDISREVGEITDHLLNLSNSKFNNRYVFSGFRTDTPAFSNALAYQGDTGTIEININESSRVATNIPGTEAFAYTSGGVESIQLADGRYVYYSPGAGTTMNVEIRASDNVTVLDSFSFDNFMQMTQIMENALASGDLQRVEALLKPLDDAMAQVSDVRSTLGARLNYLDVNRSDNEDSTLNLREVLSNTEDVDMVEAVNDVARAEVALQAMRESGATVISQSLLDFLR